jgi:ABC transport system ATP-binding/permease protein
LVKIVDGSVITASQMLERFLFPPNQQYAPIHKLSGGERRRLFLLYILMQAPNVLILDEPTNDLDVQTLGVLEDYLEDFNGCVIVVSHDRYFLDRTVNTIFALEDSGKIRQYPGNYSVYLDFKKAEEDQAAASAQNAGTASNGKAAGALPRSPENASPTASSPTQTKIRKLSYKEKREYETLEAQIPKFEAEKADIEKMLYHNPPSGFSEVQRLSERLGELTIAIDTATERWLELAELIES